MKTTRLYINTIDLEQGSFFQLMFYNDPVSSLENWKVYKVMLLTTMCQWTVCVILRIANKEVETRGCVKAAKSHTVWL